jgi:hypothetical protein
MTATSEMPATLRAVVDINIFVADILSRKKGRKGTTAQRIVDSIRMAELGGRPFQIALSLAMFDRLEIVLGRRMNDTEAAAAFKEATIELMRNGPEAVDPYLLFAGDTVPYALSDSEDAGVFATAVAANASLIITDNLADFAPLGGRIVETITAHHSDGSPRPLSVQIIRTIAAKRIVIAHPLDVLRRVDTGRTPTFEELEA